MATVEQTNDTSQVNPWWVWTESKSSWRSSIYRDWELKTGALLLLTLLLTYLVTSLISSIAIRRKKNGKETPQMPYWVPFLGNLIPFLWDPPGFCAGATLVSPISSQSYVKEIA